MKRPVSDEKIEFETKEGFTVEIPQFADSKPGRLAAWRGVLAQRAIMKKLDKVADLARQIRLLEAELYSAAHDVGEQVQDMIPFAVTPRNDFMGMEDSNGKHWYEIPVDGKNGTAHEALARYVETSVEAMPSQERI